MPTVSPGGLAKNGLHPHGKTQSLITGSHVIGVIDVHSQMHEPSHGVVVVLVVVVVVVTHKTHGLLPSLHGLPTCGADGEMTSGATHAHEPATANTPSTHVNSA